jgi:GR25 family glycosyltransferase involved in LPS biosynthesis
MSFETKIYVMNLERSISRREAVTKECIKAELDCEIFNATYGYDVDIIDLRTNYTFKGIDLRSMPYSRLDKDTKYIITCDPKNIEPTKFGYAGHPLSAGELGIWCSYKRIWQDIVKNNHEISIIFEDDIKSKVDNLKEKINIFISHLPKTFDLGYMHFGNIIPFSLLKNASFEVNEYVNKWDSNFKGVGTAAIVYSDKAVKTLLSYETYSGAVDVFFWDIRKSKDFEDIYTPTLSRGLLEIYTAADHLVFPQAATIIGEMGRNDS